MKRNWVLFINKKFTYILLLGLLACSSMPQRDPADKTTMLSYQFNIERERIEELEKKGIELENLVRILVISTSSYLREADILGKMKNGTTLDEIAAEVGIEPEILNERSKSIIDEIY